MNKKIIIGIVITLFLAIGLTYAWWTWNSTTNTDVSLTIDGININYEAGSDITNIKLLPVSSKEKGVEDNIAIKKDITVSSNTNVYMDLNMSLELFPDGLKHESLKWEIYKGNNLVNSGNLGSSNQGDVVKLLSSEKVTTVESIYTLYIWIDGNVDNPDTMQNQNFKFVLNANATDAMPLDTSGANAPKLVDNMIPVMYNGEAWVKADSTNTNSTYKWYAYQEKQWANAVLVTDTNRDSYLSATPGTIVSEDDVLAYYVWIPRYKYKVFNITKKIGTDSYNAKTTGIDIVFEEGTSSTGEIKCNNYSFAAASSSATNETCSGTNGQYYTHPAFTFGDTELTGIWVGKFESASSNPSASYGGSNSTTLTVRVKPNMNTWRNNPVSNFYTVIKNMQNNGNEYGLSSDTSKVDSHMLKNIEWGAVAYLTHSDYGRCSNGSCSEIGINNYYSGSGSSRQFKTGCGANAGSSSSGTCNEYTTSLGMNASSTGNIYGIYDLSGGAYEYVMGNMSSGSGSYTYNAKSAGSNFSYSASTAKYIDTYAYGTSYGDQTAYNRARLGDATGEVVSSSYTAWNNDYANFVYSSYPWFLRGGVSNAGSLAGVFFYRDNGVSYGDHSARAALLAL